MKQIYISCSVYYVFYLISLFSFDKIHINRSEIIKIMPQISDKCNRL